jgi:dTDP-glucose 4,6-dehydratase
MRLLVTGGLGFIGSHFIRWALAHDPAVTIVNLDMKTYAGDEANVADVDPARYTWIRGDIRDPAAVARAFAGGIDAVVHFAAESHVDRSLLSAEACLTTNVLGTQVLLDAARTYGVRRFLHVSTDEVYGALAPDEPPATETHPLAPRSPYAASKAAADLLVGAAVATWGLPAVITRGTNTYGPFQHPEKFIPLFITHALEGRDLPLYGDGQQIRDWRYVTDHVAALWAVLQRGRVGTVYNVGARNEQPNRAVAEQICALVGADPRRIRSVADRPGHDRRYALDPTRLETELGWRPQVPFAAGLAETVRWYAAHRDWWTRRRDDRFWTYYREQYGERLRS